MHGFKWFARNYNIVLESWDVPLTVLVDMTVKDHIFTVAYKYISWKVFIFLLFYIKQDRHTSKPIYFFSSNDVEWGEGRDREMSILATWSSSTQIQNGRQEVFADKSNHGVFYSIIAWWDAPWSSVFSDPLMLPKNVFNLRGIFSNQGSKCSERRRRVGLRFSYAAPKIQIAF